MSGPEFAMVEPMESAIEHGVPYYKLLVANMVISDGFSEEELLEMATRINSAHSVEVGKAVEAEREACAQIAEGYSAGHIAAAIRLSRRGR